MAQGLYKFISSEVTTSQHLRAWAVCGVTLIGVALLPRGLSSQPRVKAAAKAVTKIFESSTGRLLSSGDRSKGSLGTQTVAVGVGHRQNNPKTGKVWAGFNAPNGTQRAQ